MAKAPSRAHSPAISCLEAATASSQWYSRRRSRYEQFEHGQHVSFFRCLQCFNFMCNSELPFLYKVWQAVHIYFMAFILTPRNVSQKSCCSKYRLFGKNLSTFYQHISNFKDRKQQFVHMSETASFCGYSRFEDITNKIFFNIPCISWRKRFRTYVYRHCLSYFKL